MRNRAYLSWSNYCIILYNIILYNVVYCEISRTIVTAANPAALPPTSIKPAASIIEAKCQINSYKPLPINYIIKFVEKLK